MKKNIIMIKELISHLKEDIKLHQKADKIAHEFLSGNIVNSSQIQKDYDISLETANILFDTLEKWKFVLESVNNFNEKE